MLESSRAIQHPARVMFSLGRALRARAFFVACAALACALGSSATRASAAEPGKVDLAQLTRETQLTHQDASKLELVWWVPADIWSAVMSERTAREIREGTLGLFDDYLVFFVTEADLSPMGQINFRSEAQTRDRFRLLTADGKRISPLPESEIRSDMNVLLNSLRPVLANAAGAVGQNFRPLLFAARDAQGHVFADARKEGALRVVLGEREFRWRLPLAALLPPRRCPIDGEMLSGAFRFCPYHGAELPDPEATAAPAKPTSAR
jgi:hypothetical protein